MSVDRLLKFREPFPANQISKLPKPTKAQSDCKAEEKITCSVCGGWHHPRVIHLDYVGHAALTDRLLNIDPLWYWEPMSFNSEGLPAFDPTGGLWIRLFVLGHSRIGYGHAAASTFKEIGSREKEVIGDALRNAAMRFGAALDLWHKGELRTPEQNYDALCELWATSIDAIKEGISNNALGLASEAWAELSEEVKIRLWKAPSKGGCFTTKEREVMKSAEFREANMIKLENI